MAVLDTDETFAFDPHHLPGMTVHEYTGNGERCRHCGKIVYPNWAAATFDARKMRQNKDRNRAEPYWSRPCQAIHVGGGIIPKSERRQNRRRHRKPRGSKPSPARQYHTTARNDPHDTEP